MGKKAPKQKAYTLKDILDSDDELPTEYIDLPFVPAYQLENRFESIDKKKDKVLKQGKEQSGHNLREGLSNDATVIAQGYLNKKDTFCLLCVEPSISKKTQQWLFNFLMLKDLQAKYPFLTTCLVPSWDIHNSSANGKSFKENNEKI